MAHTTRLTLTNERARGHDAWRASRVRAGGPDNRWGRGCITGLDYWGPTMNIGRDPRWGRFQESVSEDPFLNGAYAREFVRGIQGADEAAAGGKKYTKVAACCKHFYGEPCAHGVEHLFA